VDILFLLSVNFSVLVIACRQAFEARNIKSEFAETKYIGLAVFFLSQAFLTGIPVVAITRDIPEAFYLVLSFLVFTVCMAVLSLIFIPKIIMQRAYAKLSLAEQRRKMSVSIQLSAGYNKSGQFTEEAVSWNKAAEEAVSSNKAESSKVESSAEGSKVETSSNHPAAVSETELAQDISGALLNRMEPVSETELAQDISGALVNRMEPSGPSRVSSYLDDELDNDEDDSDGDN
jgi:hypothetical protein